MPQVQRYYYSFKRNYFWLISNIIMLGLLISCGIKYPACWFWWQLQVLISLFIITLLMWCYKYLLRHQVVAVSPQGIKIDHCEWLMWHNIIGAEYKEVRCGFKKFPVISLKTTKHMRYKYNFLQKRCEKIGFGAFSIPLYDIEKEAIHKLSHLIVEKVGDIRH